MMSSKIPLQYYFNEDVVAVAKDLLGKRLVTHINGMKTAGIIVETESYRGPEDKASHAYNNRRTQRTETMFKQGGCAYIYLCYGIHHLLNIVTGQQDVPHAVLIRAIEPVEGIEHMLVRRNMDEVEHRLTAGPGVVSKAMGITREMDGVALNGSQIWLEQGRSVASKDIIESPRVGVAYAEEDALLPWRFRLKECPWTSKAK